MNSYYKIFGIGLLACLMSCSEQEIIEEQSQGRLVTATAVNSGSSVFSRLAFEDKQEDDGGVGVTWADGDKFYMEGGNGAFAEMAIVSGQGQKTAQFTGVLAGGTLAENEAVDVYYPSSVYDKENECFNVDFRTITQDCTTGNEMNHLSATYLMTGNGIKREDGVYVSFVGGTKVSMLRFDLTLPKQTTSNLTITELQIVCEDLKTVGTLTADGTQVVSEAISITDSATHTYTLSAEYVEAGSKQEGTGKNVSFTVEVVGLQLVDGVYKDAEGNTWGA